MKEANIDIDGQTMNYCRVGSGPTNVLMIPGYPGGWRQDFSQVVEQLDGGRMTVVAVDPPGYASSRPPVRDLSADFDARHARIFHKLMQMLELLPYSVMGWGDGGVAALNMASQQKDTGAVSKLVVWGVSIRISEYQRQVYNSTRNLQEWHRNMKEPYVELYGREDFQAFWGELMTAKIRRSKENRVEPLLKDVKNPVLIFQADQDSLCPKTHPEQLRDKLTNARMITFEHGTQNNLHIQRLQWFKRAVEHFLCPS